MFQRFEHARKGFSPKVSISTSGKLSLNEGAVRLWNLEKFNFVSLLYDAETKRIGLEFLEDKTMGSIFKLQFRKNSGVFISCTSFLNYFNIPFSDLTASYEVQKEKENLYTEFPELEEIDKKLSSLAFSSMIELTKNNDKKIIENLNSNIEALKKEKEKILNSIGERAKKIIPNYECKKCNDTGYILNGNSTEMCSCLKQKIYDIEYNKSNMSNLEKQNFNNFNLNFYSDEINKQKYNSDISPRENIKLIKNICDKFINNFDNTEQRNLLFTGNTGLGKTFLSSCIANELLKKDKTVLYQTASVMLDTIISYRFGKPNVSKNIYDYLLNVDLLIIDDLGTEGVNNMKLVELFNIINSRLLTPNKKTIISTNLSLQNLFNTYDERIVSRIIGSYDICYFFGEDIRFIIKK